MKKRIFIILNVLVILMVCSNLVVAESVNYNNNNVNEDVIKENINEDNGDTNGKIDNVDDATDNTNSNGDKEIVDDNQNEQSIKAETKIEENEKIDQNEIQTMILRGNQEQTIIKDGIYRISMHTNNHMALEIAGASKKSGANVQLGEWNNKENEKNKFKITYDETTDYYTIESILSENALDVQNGGMTSGTNVWQYESNGTDAQKWKIEKNDDGSYSVVSKKNGLYLSIQNENLQSAENVQVCTKNNSDSQKFDLICLDDKQEKVIENGIYKIELKENSNIVLQTENASEKNGGNINTGKWLSDSSNVQKRFKITYNEDDGYYTIKSLNSEKVLDAQNGGTTNGTNVWQYEENYTDAQRWKIENNDDGSYSFVCKKSGLYLDVENYTAEEGKNIQLYEKTNSNGQKFNLVLLDEKPEKIIENGNYRISVFDKKYSYMAFEIANASKKSGANVQLGEWNNKGNEKNRFKITYDEATGYYTIESILSGNALDVQNGGMTSGTNIWQYESNGTDAQKWKIEKNDDGSYSLASKKNGLYLDIQNQNFSTGGNVQVYEKNNKEEQKFQLISLDNISEPTIEDGIYKIEDFNNTDSVIEIQNASKQDGANVQVGQWENSSNRHKKFEITYNKDDGYYTIKSFDSEKVLDAQNGGITDRTNIWQYEENYTDAQRWKIEKNDDGSYSFVCKKSGLYLTKNNGNIEIHSKLGTDAQKFKLESADIINSEEYIEPGTYKIVVASNNEFAINIKDASRKAMANVELGKTADTLSNEFNIMPDERGYYTISSINSGNVLDVQNGGMTSGTSVWQYTNNGSDAQKWIIIQNEDGTYSIISKKNGLYIDVQNGIVSEEANIQVYEGNNTQAQKFTFIKQEDKSERYLEDGLYKVLTKSNNLIGFDIESASKQDGGILQIWKYENVVQQQFNVLYKNGYYYIININSNKAIQVIGNSIKQYDINYEDDSQKWILNWVDGQYYNIVSKSTGLCINIPNAKVENGIDLNLETNQNIDTQLFTFENAGLYIDESRYPGIKAKIDELKTKHPNWNFEILYTGINFYDAVNGEYSTKTNCLVDTSVYRGEWIASNPYSSGVWYSASDKAIAYFMDSRNFLNEVDIFQFQDLNGYNTNAITISGIQQQVKGTFLENYANDIHNACYKQNVNAYYVIARLFQEQGRKGTAIGKGMDGGDGKTYYNPFNIGAKLGNDYATALAKAKECGWDSMEKALVGGIDFLKVNWLENYQNTLYQNKFDIDTRNGTSLYSHEYMQNVSAAYSEARTLRNCYSATNTLNSEFTFIIPVYENMPATASEKPSNSSSGTVTSNSGPMDVKVVNVSSTLNVREDASTSSNIITKLTDGTQLLSIKRAVNGNWHQVVTDDGIIGYVSGDYLEFIPDRTNCNIQKVVRTESGIGIKIRIGPSIYVDQVGVLSDGTVVTSINTGTYYIDGYAWDRAILDDGRQVFAPADYLK